MPLTKTTLSMIEASGTAGSGNFLRGDGSWSSSIPTSMVRLNTANGYGTTNTRIRRFTTTVTNTGSDITYADSASLGASFTINTSGIYSVTYLDQFSAAESAMITLNDSVPAGSPVVGDVLASNTAALGNYHACASWTGYLASGSVIRARSISATSTGVNTYANQFTIVRVA